MGDDPAPLTTAQGALGALGVGLGPGLCGVTGPPRWSSDQHQATALLGCSKPQSVGVVHGGSRNEHSQVRQAAECREGAFEVERWTLVQGAKHVPRGPRYAGF